MTLCPTGWAASLFRKTPVPHQPYEAFSPDILLTDGEVLRLDEHGVAGEIRHTPGHTAGSLSVVLADKRALVGDLVASGVLIGGLFRLGRAIRPPFEDDPGAVGRELQSLLDLGVEKFFMGHGGPLEAREVHRHAARLMQM